MSSMNMNKVQGKVILGVVFISSQVPGGEESTQAFVAHSHAPGM